MSDAPYQDPWPTPPLDRAALSDRDRAASSLNHGRRQRYAGPERRHERREDSRNASLVKILIAGTLGLVTGTAGATIAFGSWVRDLAAEAAKPVIEARIDPVEKRLERHLAETEMRLPQMMEYVKEERQYRRQTSRKLDAICRAMERDRNLRPDERCPREE